MNTNEGSVPFSETWGFPDEVKKALGASWYEVLPSKDFYASGRANLIVRYYGAGYGPARTILADHDGMKLTSSKTGKPYVVSKRVRNNTKIFTTEDAQVPPRSILKREVSEMPATSAPR
jgi:hypothetical protein